MPRTSSSARSRFARGPIRTRAALLIDLGGVHREQGRFRESEAALRQARALAVDAGDAALEARAQVARLLSRLQVDPDAVARLMRRQGDGLQQVLEAGGEHGGLARLWRIRALLSSIKAVSGEAERAWRRAADEALLAGDERMFSDAVGWEAASTAVGPTRVETAIVRCGEIRAILKNDPWAEALALQPLASLHAMRGEFDVAFSLLDESAATLAGFGPTLDAAVSHPEVFSPCSRATSTGPSGISGPAGGCWSRWESARCSHPPRPTSRSCSS